MATILIVNHGSRFNKGDIALLNSRIEALNQFIADTKFVVFTYHPEVDYHQYNVRMLDVIGRISLSPRRFLKTLFYILRCEIWSILQKYFGLNLNILIKGRLQEYYNADVIISTGGDIFTEDYGLLSLFSHLSNLLPGILLNRPVVIYGESVGPFRNRLGKAIAKFIFNRVNLITLRDEISSMHLQELCITTPPIYLTADSAFLLAPPPRWRIDEILLEEGINKNTPLIGMSVSKIISRYDVTCEDTKEKYHKYVNLMAQVVDYLIEMFDATIIFVPHVMEPWGNDDRVVAKDILDNVKYKHRVISIINEYTPEEFKGIIGECDLFIGARMHACISSTSMCVPTIALAYSHKTYGVIGGMLRQEKWICDISTIDFNSLIFKINEVWANREEIKKSLAERLKDVKEHALFNGKLVKDLLERV